jgi:hypothetical protein
MADQYMNRQVREAFDRAQPGVASDTPCAVYLASAANASSLAMRLRHTSEAGRRPFMTRWSRSLRRAAMESEAAQGSTCASWAKWKRPGVTRAAVV